MDLLQTGRLPQIGKETSPSDAISAAIVLLFSVVIIAALYLGKAVFVPLAIAFLLAFVLTPVISWLRRYCMMPRPLAILLKRVERATAHLIGRTNRKCEMNTGGHRVAPPAARSHPLVD